MRYTTVMKFTCNLCKILLIVQQQFFVTFNFVNNDKLL